MSIDVPDKNCSNNCVFVEKPEARTCMYFQPIYDKSGININPDRNTTMGTMRCITCNRKWVYKERCGETSYEEVTPDLTSSLMSGIIDLNDQGC